MAPKILLIPILLIALFLPTQAQYPSYGDKDGGYASADSAAVSSISATPEASPAAAPGPALESSDPAPADSYDASLAAEPGSGGSSSETPPAVSSETPPADSSSSETPSDDSAFSTLAVTPWRKTDNLDTEPIMSHEVPADKKASVKLFVQSAMQATQSKTQDFITTVIDKRLKDPQIGTYTKDCLQTCKEVYEDSEDAMKKTMEDVHEGNYFKANVDVTAISTDAETCKDCVKMVYGQDPELDKFNKWVDGVIDKCLTMITGYKA
nr:uncharacterized serine-rich protein C1E8.05-like [Ipomoea batatas]